MTRQAALYTAHTHELTPALLEDVRAFLDTAFAGDFGDDDWDHTLGGVHVLARGDDGDLLAHGSVIQRRVIHEDRSYRIGYVESVAVRADRRREGLGGRLMAALEGVIDRAYDFGALSASTEGALLYEARGWELWRGSITALGPRGTVPLPEEEGSAYVRGGPAIRTGTLLFDWRDGDVL
ncbi:GNAT family N-acetyltransferase [Streptomyces fulvorobeus]|uniref:Aminoglycoside 2'-N-acetyltransferase n=1 Tax=Streptomyces fulvorobeus TaxID=284028 RepID=A0A7J0CAK2_9ACTN|nr:GNAT family N-acetyltransferase [Streptomyces fulvorobeus]NYE43129.1 aminoglycoside 2'-N-acetyltransferase I [Streptomyces fulvorobeus]GFM99575.1 aminoglycoside 2'-N-acetyltransferase [Streptomyces fulvorobeus]